MGNSLHRGAKMDTATIVVGVAGVEADAKEDDTTEKASLPLTQSPSTRRPLLPILPQYPPPAGALVVDKEEIA